MANKDYKILSNFREVEIWNKIPRIKILFQETEWGGCKLVKGLNRF